MGFAAALDATRTIRGPQCSVTKVLLEMTPDDISGLQAAMADNNIDSTSIERALLRLREDGELRTKIGKGAVGRHRKRECGCFEGS